MRLNILRIVCPLACANRLPLLPLAIRNANLSRNPLRHHNLNIEPLPIHNLPLHRNLTIRAQMARPRILNIRPNYWLDPHPPPPWLQQLQPRNPLVQKRCYSSIRIVIETRHIPRIHTAVG